MLDSKVTIVTGGAQGIGSAIVEAFSKEGARVAIFDLNTRRAAELAANLNTQGCDVHVIRADVSDPASVQSGIETVLNELGPIQILVNNAGIYPRKSWDEMKLDDWDHVLRTNLRSCFMCSQGAYPSMRETGWGRIINLSSVTFWLGVPRELVHYITSKGAIIGFTRALAKEVGFHGTTVNAITPGAVATENEKDFVSEEDLRGMLKMQALQIRVLPEDIARTALFLASDWARAITGQVINVDGGWHMH